MKLNRSAGALFAINKLTESGMIVTYAYCCRIMCALGGQAAVSDNHAESDMTCTRGMMAGVRMGQPMASLSWSE